MVESLNLFGDLPKSVVKKDNGDSGSRRKSHQAYKTISEVADELNVATHVLRFWETKFPEVSPMKRSGGRRYYRPEDVEILKRIQNLLHDEGYTIKGVQSYLKREHVKGHVKKDLKAREDEERKRITPDVIKELRDIRALLD